MKYQPHAFFARKRCAVEDIPLSWVISKTNSTSLLDMRSVANLLNWIDFERNQRVIKEDNLSEENLQEYSDYVDENIGKKFKKLITVRDFIYNLEDEDMNEYIGAIANANITKLSTKALLKAMIKVSPRKLLKLRKLL